MADEVIEAATSLKRDYSLKTYTAMREALVEKARALGPQWTPERVGRALWVCAQNSTAKQEGNDRKGVAKRGAPKGKDEDEETPRKVRQRKQTGKNEEGKS
jgi:hypothetical protein